MKRQLIRLGAFLLFLLIFGGVGAFNAGLEGLWEVIKTFLPILGSAVKQSLEDYLTSPYFIVGIILFILSAFGIYVCAKGGKVLYFIFSVICEIISLASIFSNLANCG